MVKKLSLYTISGLLSVITILMLVSAFFINNKKGYSINFYFITAICLAVFIALIYITVIKEKLDERLFMVLVVLITAGLRLIWILKVPTLPASDFLAYQSYAYYFSNGFYISYDPTYTVFPFKIGYPIALSILYRITGIDINAAKALNIILSVASALLLYHIGRQMLDKKAGKIAALMFAVWPAQIIFTSVLAAEHIFLVFFLLSIYFLVKLKSKQILRYEILYAALTGVSITASQFFRPVSLIMFPVAAVYIFIICEHSGTIPKKAGRKLLLFGVIVLGYFISLYSLNMAVEPVTSIDITRSSPGMSMLIGTNFESGGTYNKDDAGFVSKYGYDYEKVHSAALDTAISRIREKPAEFAGLVVKKYGIVWGNENYGLTGAMSNTDKRITDTELLTSLSALSEKASQAYYMTILLLAAAGCLLAVIHKVSDMIVSGLIILGFALSFCFFEVQSRYHMPAVPMLFLIAAVGCTCLFGSSGKKLYIPRNNEKSPASRIWFNAFTAAVCTVVLTSVVLLSRNDIGFRQHLGLIPPSIKVDGIEHKTDPMPAPIKNLTLAPIDSLAKMTGAVLILDDGGSITLSKGDRKLVFYPGSSTVCTNDQTIDMGVPAIEMHGTVYVPLRAAAEGLGMTVSYESKTATIEIRTQSSSDIGTDPMQLR